jgi:hypothetical protein
MTKGRYNQLKPLPSTKERILALVKDMTLSMSAEDYNPLPDILVNDIWIDFSFGVMYFLPLPSFRVNIYRTVRKLKTLIH